MASPRLSALVTLVALVPAAAYTLMVEMSAGIAVVNVLLIMACLWIALSPHEEQGGAASAH